MPMTQDPSATSLHDQQARTGQPLVANCATYERAADARADDEPFGTRGASVVLPLTDRARLFLSRAVRNVADDVGLALHAGPPTALDEWVAASFPTDARDKPSWWWDALAAHFRAYATRLRDADATHAPATRAERLALQLATDPDNIGEVAVDLLSDATDVDHLRLALLPSVRRTIVEAGTVDAHARGWHDGPDDYLEHLDELELDPSDPETYDWAALHAFLTSDDRAVAAPGRTPGWFTSSSSSVQSRALVRAADAGIAARVTKIVTQALASRAA
ncbi:MAG: hypothetical protein AAGC49_12190 [Brevundimonas sp.]